MHQIKVTLCLPWQVRDQQLEVPDGNSVRKAIYDAMQGQFCWAVVEYESPSGGKSIDSLWFRLEGLGLPSMLNYSFDREPPPGITFEPNGLGALVPVKVETNLEPVLTAPSGRKEEHHGAP